MKNISKQIIVLLVIITFIYGNNENNRWLKPLNLGLEFAKISYYGPVLQYNIYNQFQMTCKVAYNPNVEKFFILPGIKYSLKQPIYGVYPHIGVHYNTLDYVKYNKMYWNGMEIIGYYVMGVFVPAESTKQESNLDGVCLYGGVEYPVGNVFINLGIGTSYFPKIEDDNNKFVLTYKLGLYYSFNSKM